jgi:hypothetical protein
MKKVILTYTTYVEIEKEFWVEDEVADKVIEINKNKKQLYTNVNKQVELLNYLVENKTGMNINYCKEYVIEDFDKDEKDIYSDDDEIFTLNDINIF